MASFNLALKNRNEDFFISFGDVLFKPYLLKLFDEFNDDIVISVDTQWQNSANKNRAADYVRCNEPHSRDSYSHEIFLDQCGEDLKEEEIHGEWMGVARFSKEIIPELNTILADLESRDDFNKLKFHHLFQHLTDLNIKVRVIYTTGHWLDIDSLDDVVEASNFL